MEILKKPTKSSTGRAIINGKIHHHVGGIWVYCSFCNRRRSKWNIKDKLKVFWYFHLLKRCPVCKSKLVKMGYAEDFLQRYKCIKCKWGVL